MDREEAKKMLEKLGANQEFIEKHAESYAKSWNDSVNDEQAMEKNLRLYKEVHDLLITLFMHFQMDRHRALKFFILFIGDQLSDHDEHSVNLYLSCIKLAWEHARDEDEDE